jgi:hypothetical protein
MTQNYVIINSKYRTDPVITTTSNFIYRIGESLEVSDIAIKSVTMVNAQYNVKLGNNTLIINDGVTDYNITIPIGQYDIQTLITALQIEIINAVGGTCIISLDTLTQKLIFNTSIPLKYKGGNLGFNIGFGGVAVFTPSVQALSVNAPYFPNLQGPTNYYIVSSSLAGSQGSILRNNSKRQIILTIPVDNNFGEIITYEVNEINLNKRVFSRPVNIQDIDIRIIDDDDQIVDLQQTNIEIVLQITVPSALSFIPVQG